MRFPWTRRIELREDTRTGFSEQSIDAAVEAATGASPELAAARTAAAEFGVGLFARAFASATVDPPVAALTPVVLASLIRRLLLTGNAVYRVRVSPRTGIALDAASSFDITGRSNPETWFYRMDIPAPSVVERAHARYASVVHIRINAASESPWLGSSPLASAGLSSRLLSRLELRMSEEAGSRSGYLLPIPSGTPEEIQDGLKRDLANMKGNVGLVESTAAGWGQGRDNAPQVDWQHRRFGATIPVGNIEIRRDASADVLGVIGVPPAMWKATDGTSLREGYRQFLASGLRAYATLIESELSLKLERPLRLNFSRLAAADVSGRARAYGVLVTNGMSDADAREITGIDD